MVLVLASCTAQAPKKATVLYFKEWEPGMSEAVNTRMIITADFLRMDDGNDDHDFLLFDRKEAVIYNISSADRTIVVIRKGETPATPDQKPDYKASKLNEKLPGVGGREVVHYQYRIGDVVCLDVYAAADLLPQAVSAFREYRNVLATEHAAVLNNIPPEMRSACDTAVNIYNPVDHLSRGFPVRESDATGRARELVDFRIGEAVKPGWWKLPEAYKRYSPSQLRSG